MPAKLRPKDYDQSSASQVYEDFRRDINTDEDSKLSINARIEMYEYVLIYAGVLTHEKPKYYRKANWLYDLIDMWNKNMVFDNEPNLK